MLVMAHGALTTHRISIPTEVAWLQMFVVIDAQPARLGIELPGETWGQSLFAYAVTMDH